MIAPFLHKDENTLYINTATFRASCDKCSMHHRAVHATAASQCSKRAPFLYGHLGMEFASHDRPFQGINVVYTHPYNNPFPRLSSNPPLWPYSNAMRAFCAVAEFYVTLHTHNLAACCGCSFLPII